MSKTLKLTVSFPMTIIMKAETVKQFEEARIEARKITPEKLATVKGQDKFRVELFRSDKPTEEVLETIYRAGIRELVRKELMDELVGSEATGTIGNIKVVFEAPMVPRSCDRCIKDTCGRSERLTNAGCALKMTGLREACGGPRWTETV